MLNDDALYVTDVWGASDRVIGEMRKLAKKKRELVYRFHKLIQRCASVGFGTLESNLLRNEGGAVYCLGDRHGPLLRAAGFFFDGHSRETFIFLDFFEKHGTRQRGNEKENYKEVARIRDNHGWKFARKKQ